MLKWDHKKLIMVVSSKRGIRNADSFNILWNKMNICLNFYALITLLLAALFFGCCPHQPIEESLSALFFGCCTPRPIEESLSVNEIPKYIRDMDVNCQLTVRKIGEDQVAEVTFTNHSGQIVFMETRHLLMNHKMEWAAFEVMRDGIKIPYRGRTIKRGPPRCYHFYKLLPDTSFTTSVRIRDCYDISAPGQYTIKFWAFNSSMPMKNVVFVIESNVAEFEVE